MYNGINYSLNVLGLQCSVIL